MRPYATLAAALVLLSTSSAMAQGERALNLSFRGAALQEVVDEIAAKSGLKILLSPDLDTTLPVTMDLTDVTGEQALRQLSRLLNADLARIEDTWVVQPRRTGAPAVGSRPGTAPSAPRRDDLPRLPSGTPSVQPKRYQKIILKYAYAPGIAALLGGIPLRQSDLDPGLSLGGIGGPYGGWGGGQGGWGGGQGGWGGGQGGFGQGGWGGGQGVFGQGRGAGGFGQGGFGGDGQGGWGAGGRGQDGFGQGGRGQGGFGGGQFGGQGGQGAGLQGMLGLPGGLQGLIGYDADNSLIYW